MWHLKFSRFKSFLISRPSVRFTILFFYNNILPYLKYFLYFLIFILTAILIYLAIFDQNKLLAIKNRLINYSHKAINLKGDNLYLKINIEGNKYTKYEEIVKPARKWLVDSEDINNHKIVEYIKTEIESLPWVEEVVISINLQDSLNIKITEYHPFAIWQNGNKNYIISKNGEIIAAENINQFDNLIILTGDNANKNVSSLFNILAINPNMNSDIYSAAWVGNRRWDIRFADGLLVKLPAKNIKNAWDNLIKIYNMPGSKIGLKAIDLRIANKIYLEYDKKIIKEIKTFK